VFRKVIEEFIRLLNNNLIRGSQAIWNTIRENTRKSKKLNEIPKIKYETGIIVGSKGLTYGFSDYFFKKKAEYLKKII